MTSQRTLMDDIAEAFENERRSGGLAEMPPDVLKEFMSDLPAGGGSSKPQGGLATSQTPQASSRTPQEPQAAPMDLSGMSMDELLAAARACAACPLREGRKNLVFGAGDPNADLMFIGEGPGREEDEQGVPFVGEAGQLLTKMINAMTFQRSEVYIANIVKCRPPHNRNPEEVEAKACLQFLFRQIELISPKVIVLLGAVPLRYLLGKTGVTRLRGNWLEFRGIRVMPTFHPAYLLRNPSAKASVWQDLQKVMAVFGKTPAQKIEKR